MRAISIVVAVIILASCSASDERNHEGPTKAACSVVGQRIREEHLRGIIFGEVGSKAELGACPGVRLPFAFIGEEPAEYVRLKQLAEQRHDVLGFNAKGDGYIVTDGPGEYVLLLITLADVREDPSIAKRARAATR